MLTSRRSIRPLVILLTVVLASHGLPTIARANDAIGTQPIGREGKAAQDQTDPSASSPQDQASVAGSLILPVEDSAAGAHTLASAMVADPSGLVDAAFVAHPPTSNGYPNAISTGLREFPTSNVSFGIMTSGNAVFAATANTSTDTGRNLYGGNVRGDTDFDVSILRLDLQTPTGANCLALDFAFLSEEYPEYVGDQYNDAFIAELDGSTWATSGSSISAPDNFAFDPTGNVISINTTGYSTMSSDEAVGTTYDGGTPILHAARQVGPGVHSLYLSVFDQGDHIYDSAVLIDNIRYFVVANPATGCSGGSLPAGPPVDQTYGGWCSVTTDVTGSAGDPVDTATGNFFLKLTDLLIPAPGISYDLTRTYNSADASSGSLGVGWRHSLETRVRPIGQDLEWIAPDGARLRFDGDGSGTYVPPLGGRARAAASGGGGWTVTQLDGIRYLFDGGGLLVGISDRPGNTLTVAYSGGRIATVTDPAGRVMTYAYDGSGYLSSVTDPIGRSVTYSVTAGRLASATDVNGGTVTYTYDGSGRLTTLVDQNGHTQVTNTYGPSGRVTSQTDASGNTSLFAWDAATSTSRVTDPRGGVWTDRYAANKLVERIDPLGNATSYAYDLDFNVIAATDARGNTTEFSWDGSGMLVGVTAPAPLSYTQTLTYNAAHQVTSVRDGKGRTTTFTYDGAGNLTRTTGPDGAAIAFTYNASGQPTTATDALGNQTRYSYDANGNVTAIQSPSGDETRLTYDTVGRPVSLIGPRGNVVGANPALYTSTFGYDAAGLVTSVTDPMGHQATAAYDAAGNTVLTTDPNGNQTNYLFDTSNRLVQITDAAGGKTTQEYGSTGLLQARTDALGHTTTFDHDLAGRLSSMRDPLGRERTFAYDPNGNVTTTVDAAGRTTTFEYDVLGRLTAARYSDTTPDVMLGYDANNNLVSMTDGSGTETYVYDSQDRLTSVTRAGRTFTYAYDLAGRITSRVTPGGITIPYAYDADGRMTMAGETSYTYLPGGLLSTATNPGGVTTKVSWDRAGRTTEVAHVTGAQTISRKSYAYDAIGNVLATTDAGGATAYRYDVLNRLTDFCRTAVCPNGLSAVEIACATCIGSAAQRPDATVAMDSADTYGSYVYDAVGNRVQETGTDGTSVYDYDEADQLTAVHRPDGTTVTYAYDENGNQTQAGSSTFTYDAAGRMTSATVGGATETYSWSGDGLRLAVAGDTGTTSYWWDRAWALPQIAEETGPGRNGQPSVLRSYAYGLGPARLIAAGKVAYYQLDALGSVMGMTSASGRPLSWTDYDPFGATSAAGDARRAPTNRLLFTGQYRDDLTETYQLRARQYDPLTGRFMAIDPVMEAMSSSRTSPYTYARNNPGRYVDPSGRIPFILLAIAGAALIGAAINTGSYLIDKYTSNEEASPGGIAGSAIGGGAGGALAAGAAVAAPVIGVTGLAATAFVGIATGLGGVIAYTGSTVGDGGQWDPWEAALEATLALVGGKVTEKVFGTALKMHGFLPSTWKGFFTKTNGQKFLMNEFLAGVHGMSLDELVKTLIGAFATIGKAK